MSPSLTNPAWRLLFAAGILTFVSGCATISFPIPDESLRITDPGVLLERVAQRRERIRTVSTTGRITSRSPAGQLSGRLTTMVTAAGLLRLDAWTPTWDLAGSFVGDPEGFVYFMRGENVCRVGESTPAVIKAILPLGLDYHSMVSILMGSPPITGGSDWTVEWDSTTGLWLVTGKTSGTARQRLWVDGDGVTRRILLTEDGLSTDIRFSGFVEAAGEKFPSTISIDMDRNSTTVIFKDIDVNLAVSPEDFEQKCPEGLTSVYYYRQGL